jgi:hypothetical protein
VVEIDGNRLLSRRLECVEWSGDVVVTRDEVGIGCSPGC